jgi:hypothetical protein
VKLVKTPPVGMAPKASDLPVMLRTCPLLQQETPMQWLLLLGEIPFGVGRRLMQIDYSVIGTARLWTRGECTRGCAMRLDCG